MNVFPPSPPANRIRQERVQRNWRQQDLADQLETTVSTVKRWERGSQQPSAYFRIKLCALFDKSAEELGLVEKCSPLPHEKNLSDGTHRLSLAQKAFTLWTVPYGRNPHFTGREALLDRLTEQLAPGEGTNTRQAVLSQPQAIQGLGGIGKTQLALEYAYRSREQDRYTYIFWVNATNEEAILTSFQTLAELLPDFASRDTTDQDKLIAAILRWFQNCPHPWLLIVDNADDLTLVQPYLPQSQHGQGSILLTTRAHAVAALANPIEVDSMGLVEGTQFLLHRSQHLEASDEERNEASNIVIALDGFPLALDQAGAYIEETGCSFGDYLQLYQHHHQTLLARRGRQATNYPESVATTWSLSFQKVEQANPAAAELLRLCAFLAPDHIPEELLREGAPYWPPVLQQAATNLLTFNQMIEDVLAFSLIKRLAEDHMLIIHRLVQVVQMDMIEPGEHYQWAERVIRAVNAIFPRDPEVDVTSWPHCLRYLEQAQACDMLIQQHQLLLPEAAEILERTGVYLCEHASYVLAEPLYERARAMYEHQVGPDHLQVASPLHHLAELYRLQGKYREAEPLFQRALGIREQHLGPQASQVAASLCGLGNLYRAQGKFTEAEPLYQRAVTIYERQLGPEHLQVATPLYGLGIIYKAQGKFTVAESLYQRALQIREQQLGPGHSLVAYPLNGLALLYSEQGRYREAEPLYQRALQIWEQQLGPEHPLVATLLNNLGILYRDQQRYREAESLFQRALQIWEQRVGPDHPDVAHSLTGLAELYRDQQRYREAEPLYQRALHIGERQLGPDHPNVAHSLNNLGELYNEQGKEREAEPFYQRALQIWEHQLGLEHPLVAHPLTGLAKLSRAQGNYTQAERLFQRALTIREHTLDAQHPDIAETLQGFAALREAQGKLQEARSLYQRALTIREHVIGAQHVKTNETRTRLCTLLQAMGQTEEAAMLQAAQP